jgi:hypothetical protein
MRTAFLTRVLAILRTRIAGAVLMPALLAGSYAHSRHAFRLPGFLLILLGLIAAEYADLLISDLLAAAKGKTHELPGSPVWPWLLKSPPRGGFAFALLGACGAAVLAILFVQIGPGILVLVGIAAACALLYAFQPFPGAFLATSLVPALITGGTFYALSGGWDATAFLAGLPICLVSVGVILTYRVAYRAGLVRTAGKAAVILCYLCALLGVALLVFCGVYAWIALFAIVPGALLVAFAARLLAREKTDSTPATADGVLLHTVLSLSLAALLAV